MFQSFTGQSVPEDVIFMIHKTGLTNQDFLFSDFLHILNYRRYENNNNYRFHID